MIDMKQILEKIKNEYLDMGIGYSVFPPLPNEPDRIGYAISMAEKYYGQNVHEQVINIVSIQDTAFWGKDTRCKVVEFEEWDNEKYWSICTDFMQTNLTEDDFYTIIVKILFDEKPDFAFLCSKMKPLSLSDDFYYYYIENIDKSFKF